MEKIAVSFMRLMMFMVNRVQFSRPSTSTSNTSVHLKVTYLHFIQKISQTSAFTRWHAGRFFSYHKQIGTF